MNRVFLSGMFVICLLTAPVRAAINIDTEAVKKTIVFIYAARPDGDVDENASLGTGFFVSVPQKGDRSREFLLLVTARHIVDPNWAYCAGPNPGRIFVRLNKRNYNPRATDNGVGYVSIQLTEAGRPKYEVSTDDEVDAAVILLNHDSFSTVEYDYGGMFVDDFANPREIGNLGVGDSIVTAGLLPAVSGARRNYPLFKFGNLASIPDEPLWTSCEQGMLALRLERVWLVAANLVGGNSGSPIFFVPPGGRGMIMNTSIGRPVLIGVQSSALIPADVGFMTPVRDVFDIIQRMNLPDADLTRGSDAVVVIPKH